MSRLDIFTIVVVIICVAAIVFLLYRTTDLFKSKETLDDLQQTESLYEDDGTLGDDYSDDPYYSDTSEFDFLADTGSVAQPESEPAPAEAAPAVKEEAYQPSKPALENIDEMSDSGGNYLVLAGAFTIMANAEVQAARLKKMGFSEARVALFNRGKYATVLVDRFENKSDATALVSRLGESGVDAYVHLKRAAKQ
jgi:cell division septation protein DedD